MVPITTEETNMAAGADFNKTVNLCICTDSGMVSDSHRSQQARIRTNLHEVSKNRVALLDPHAQAAERTRIDDAARTNNSSLSCSETAVGMLQEIGITDLCFRVEICLVVTASKFRNCAGQKRYRTSVQIGIILNGTRSSLRDSQHRGRRAPANRDTYLQPTAFDSQKRTPNRGSLGHFDRGEIPVLEWLRPLCP